MPPKTPPTTGAAVNFGFDEIPAAADDSSACAETVVAVTEVVLDDTWEPDPSLIIPVDVGLADTSLCAIGITVLEDLVGVVPFEAGEAEVDVSLVLVVATGVTVSTGATDVVAATGVDVEEVVVSGSGVDAIEVVGAALDVEMTEIATLGELP